MSDPKFKINFDKAHGPWPDHADIWTKKLDFGANKIRVDKDGNILSSELYWRKTFLKDLEKGK